MYLTFAKVEAGAKWGVADTWNIIRLFEFDPDFINVNSARKCIGFKKTKDKLKNTKEQVLEHVSFLEPGIEWPKKILKSGPRRGTEVLQNYCYDMADAYVIVKSQMS